MVITDRRRAESPTAAKRGDPAWVKAIFLAPALAGSFAALMVLGKTRAFRRWLGRGAVHDLETLRGSVVGQTRRRVMALFGHPPAATSAPNVTWYYPVAEAHRTAMAISFEDDRAVRVEFFAAPG